MRERPADRVLLVVLEHRVVRWSSAPRSRRRGSRAGPTAGQRGAQLALARRRSRARAPCRRGRPGSGPPCGGADAARAELVGLALGHLQRDPLARHRRTMVAEPSRSSTLAPWPKGPSPSSSPTDAASRAGAPARRTLRQSSSTWEHPAQASRSRPLVDATLARGARFVTYSRPGYAGSTRLEGRSVADCAADAAALLDTLEVDRAHVVGWSGGGPHALACAALLPELVTSGATLAGVAPWDAAGLDWLEGMAQENLDEFAAVLEGPEALLPVPGAARRRPGRRHGRDGRGGARRAAHGRRPRGAHRGVRGVSRAGRADGRVVGTVGLARRRPRVRPRLGVRPRRREGARDRLAGRARRDGSLPRTASGSPTTSPARAGGSSPTRATSRSSPASATSSTTCSARRA